MAVKTITIDIEAYEALARHKRPGQSFSQVIKEHLGGRRTAGAFRRLLGAADVSERTLSRVEAVAGSRGKSPARVPGL